jgi:hypothetical protein
LENAVNGILNIGGTTNPSAFIHPQLPTNNKVAVDKIRNNNSFEETIDKRHASLNLHHRRTPH